MMYTRKRELDTTPNVHVPKCKSCGSIQVFNTRNGSVCGECGNIVEARIIDYSPEIYDNENSKKRRHNTKLQTNGSLEKTNIDRQAKEQKDFLDLGLEDIRMAMRTLGIEPENNVPVHARAVELFKMKCRVQEKQKEMKERDKFSKRKQSVVASLYLSFVEDDEYYGISTKIISNATRGDLYVNPEMIKKALSDIGIEITEVKEIF